MIPLPEYRRRRERILKALDGAIGLVLAGDGAPPLSGRWEPDPMFAYLTGITDEPGASILFDPRSEDAKRRCVLFLKPIDPERDEWDGYRDRISFKLREKYGFDTILRTMHLPRILTTIARKRGRLACLHPFAVYDAPPSRDLATFRKVAERCPGISIIDRTDLLSSMRAVKSASEVRLIQRAIDATAAGIDAALATIRPGVTERRIQSAIENAFLDRGASGPAYNSIVGAGLNSCILHYMASTGVAEDGDLVVLDVGARYGGYAADITRTFPVSGRFTREQRGLYNVVLESQLAAIRVCRSGRYPSDFDAAARKVIEKAGYGDAFIHGCGHPLGLEVHDINPDHPLRPGMVVTVEPGIYFPDRKLGIRIEDDVLITRNGPRVLSSAIPKTVEAIERRMRRRK